MIKKLKKIVLLTLLVLSMSAPLILATSTETYAASPENLIPKPIDQDTVSSIKPKDTDKSITEENLATYEGLPDVTYQGIFRTVIKTVLYLSGILATIGLIVAGVMFLSSSTNEENLVKARKILVYIVMGIVIISVSYAVVTGILKIKLVQ